MTLNEIGFDHWFERQLGLPAMEGCEPARVTAVDRGSCVVRTGAGEVAAELCGKLAFHTDDAADLPCVGDWVAVRLHSGGTAAMLHHVLPRRSFLRRRSPGADRGHQMLAANVDTALLAQSCHYDFNPARLKRGLVMAADGGVEPVVLLTKTDLAGPEELERLRRIVAGLTDARVLTLSCRTGEGLAGLTQALRPGRTYCLIGSSGVGKTTLLNRLLGHDSHETAAVSATGEGRHTTTRRQLTALAGGALVIDTPGIRELGLAGADEGLNSEFEEMALLGCRCRFTDCRHEREPGCAVLAAVERGDLSKERYASYLKLRRESEFHDLSQADRRLKDKRFGKLVKSAKKASRG